MAKMLQKPVFALPGCQPTSVKTLLCDTLGLAKVQQKTGVYPYTLGAGSARPYPKKGAPETGNPVFIGFTALRGDWDHGLRPWSRKGPDHGVGLDPSLLAEIRFAREGGRTLRKDVFLPSKHLLSAFYKTLPSKNPSKNLFFTKNPYRRLLRTLLRSNYC